MNYEYMLNMTTLKIIMPSEIIHTKRVHTGQVRWLSSVIPATLEAETGRNTVQGQSRQKFSKIPFQ
jgi:hypothetical protein